MIVFTSAQLDAWLGMFIFPLSRILGLMAMAPVFNNVALPVRVRLITGLAVAFAIAPALPPMPSIPGGSWTGLMMLAEQFLIGLLMGFALRIAFAAVDVAGELIGLQMGLSFAVFFDPVHGGQTPVVSELLGLLTTLIFLAMNGHLLTLAALAESFSLVPVATEPFRAAAFSSVVGWGASLFATGLLLALPVITALLIANIALGVLARIAQQLNIFAVGFPVTLTIGFLVLMLSIPYIGKALERVFTKGFEAMDMVMRAAGG